MDPSTIPSDVEQPSASTKNNNDNALECAPSAKTINAGDGTSSSHPPPKKSSEGGTSRKRLIFIIISVAAVLVVGLAVGLGIALHQKSADNSSEPDPTDKPEPTPQPTPPCVDSVAWVDKNNKSCGFYQAIGCGSAGRFRNAAKVDATQACCLCGGGNKNFDDTGSSASSSCQNMYGFVDTANYACSDYDTSYECSTANFWPNSKGITAKIACCRCGGGSQ